MVGSAIAARAVNGPLNSRAARRLTGECRRVRPERFVNHLTSKGIKVSTGRPPHARVPSYRRRRGAARRLRESADGGQRRRLTANREIKLRQGGRRGTLQSDEMNASER